MTKGICRLLVFLCLLTVDLLPTIVVQDNDFIIAKKKRQIDKAPNRPFFPQRTFGVAGKAQG